MTPDETARAIALNKAIVDFWAAMDRRDAEGVVKAKEAAHEVFAAALAAETERCAKVVESCATGEDDKVRMQAIAAAIRRG